MTPDEIKKAIKSLQDKMNNEITNKIITINSITSGYNVQSTLLTQLYSTLIYDVLIINLTCVCRKKVIAMIRNYPSSSKISEFIKQIASLIVYTFYFGINIIVGNYEMIILECLGILWNYVVEIAKVLNIDVTKKNEGFISFMLCCVNTIVNFTGSSVIVSFLIKYLGQNELFKLRDYFAKFDKKFFGGDYTKLKYNPDIELTYLQTRLNHSFPSFMYYSINWLIDKCESDKVKLYLLDNLGWMLTFVMNINIADLIKSVYSKTVKNALTIAFNAITEYVKSFDQPKLRR